MGRCLAVVLVGLEESHYGLKDPWSFCPFCKPSMVVVQKWLWCNRQNSSWYRGYSEIPLLYKLDGIITRDEGSLFLQSRHPHGKCSAVVKIGLLILTLYTWKDWITWSLDKVFQVDIQEREFSRGDRACQCTQVWNGSLRRGSGTTSGHLPCMKPLLPHRPCIFCKGKVLFQYDSAAFVPRHSRQINRRNLGWAYHPLRHRRFVCNVHREKTLPQPYGVVCVLEDPGVDLCRGNI